MDQSFNLIFLILNLKLNLNLHILGHVDVVKRRGCNNCHSPIKSILCQGFDFFSFEPTL